MSSRTDRRTKLRALFLFDDIITRPVWLVIADLLQIAVVFATFGFVAFNPREGRADVTGINFLEGVLAACVMLVLSTLFLFSLQLLYKLIAGEMKNHRRARLEANALEIMRDDYKRALKALLLAAKISPDDLTEVDKLHQPPLEDILFSKNELAEFFGPLMTQTLRSITPASQLAKYAPLTRDRLKPDAYFKGIYAPFQVSCVFFTRKELIIGEAVCDPFTGKIRKRLRRISRQQVRSAEFTRFQTPADVPETIIESWLRNRRLDPEEQSRVRKRLKRAEEVRLKSINRGRGEAQPAYLIRQEQTGLDITLRSGKIISLPIANRQTILQSDNSGLQLHNSNAYRAHPTDDARRDAVLSAFLGDEGFSARSGSAHVSAKLSNVRALWSSGRQQSHREFVAIWPLIRSLAAALVIGGCIIMLMNALTTDTFRWKASTDETDVRIQTPSGDTTLIPPGKRLSDLLISELENNKSTVIACTFGSMRVYRAPDDSSETLSIIVPEHPLIAFTPSAEPGTEQQLPDGWLRVITETEGKRLTGYARVRDLDLRGPKVRTVCFP